MVYNDNLAAEQKVSFIEQNCPKLQIGRASGARLSNDTS